NNTEAATELLKSGADPNEGRFFGSPALLFAIIHSNHPVLREMLAHGADPKLTDRHGSTMLMWAVGTESPKLEIIEELLKSGADVNAQNKQGESALTWAARRGQTAIIERLKAAGASDAGEVRRSVENAVALLQKSGPQFVKVSGCVSCHHQSLPQMVYAAARQRGYQIDAPISEQQVKAVVAMFKPIREQMENGTIRLPNPGISVSYSLLGLAAEGYAPDDTTNAMAMAISRTQLPDGSFFVVPARPPMEASAFTSTALSIRALQIYGHDCNDRLSRAQQWLLKARPATQEERTMRLLGLVWSNAAAKDIEQAAAELLAQQRSDGGWAQLAGTESDAYATGQALVALHEAGLDGKDAKAFQHGVAYLLRTQLADGSWLVRTRSSPVQPLKDSGFPHGRDQWISAAGTSWAALALSLSQPATAGETAGGLF
ncbi:MAG TPA: ankyrin repeat domain-containing protein, partial [Bryobacteraceae bacterium]|nr:ankyrin repeat domain-containing protein [Bryobacteraceae bacterium]